MPVQEPSSRFVPVHARLFPEDVEQIKRWAEERGIPWQVELRLLVRRAVGEKRLGVLEIEPPIRGSR